MALSTYIQAIAEAWPCTTRKKNNNGRKGHTGQVWQGYAYGWGIRHNKNKIKREESNQGSNK